MKDFERFHSPDAAVAERMSQLGDPGIELTDERLQEFNEQEQRARRALGPSIVTHARQLGLVEALTPEQAKVRLALAPHVNLAEEVNQKHNDFILSGWDVLLSKGDNKPVLLVPSKSEERQVSFETVSLDDLHAKDPEFLSKQIKDYEEKYAMLHLANSVIYNLGLHQVPEAKLLPEFMREFVQITDPKQREKEVQSIQAFMGQMVGLGREYENIIRTFISDVLMRVRDDRVFDFKYYLRHMAECPTQTAESHQRNADLTRVYNIAFLTVDPNASSLDRYTEHDDLLMRVLKSPAIHTAYSEQAEKRHIVDREQYQKVIDLIAETEGITDRTQLLEALQQKLPDFHATLVRFQESLGTDYSKKNKFDELISRTAMAISGDEKFDLERLNDALGRELGSGEFEGVDKNAGFGRAYIWNRHLEAVLPLMIIKAAQAQAQAEAREKKGDRLMGDYYKRKAQNCQRFTQEFAQSYKEKIGQIDKALQKIAEDSSVAASLKKQTGITDNEIARLIRLAKRENKNADFSPETTCFYTSLFLALVLEKKGIVNMHSPTFKGLLKSLFPGKPETVWGKQFLQNLLLFFNRFYKFPKVRA